MKYIDFLKNKSQLAKICGFIFAVLVVLWSIFFVDHEKSHFSLENFPGFWTLFTLFSCLVIVFFAKIYGSLGIKQEEDYYDK